MSDTLEEEILFVCGLAMTSCLMVYYITLFFKITLIYLQK